jgi:SAM-dependent methyltransferase
MSAFSADGDFVPRLPAYPLRAVAPTDPSFGRLIANSSHCGGLQLTRLSEEEHDQRFGVLATGLDLVVASNRTFAVVAFSNPAAYEQWMGRWSRRLAPSFVKFASLPESARVLDVGSGTGALSEALLEMVAGSTVVGIEPSEDYVTYSRNQYTDDRLEFYAGDALQIPFEDDSFDATLSLLILQELPDAALALKEMQRVTRPGGWIAASQWDFANGMPMLSLFWDTVLEVVESMDAEREAADCLVVDYPNATALQGLWRDSGLIEIEIERQSIEMRFSSFEDYWTPFLSNVTPTSSYVGKLRSSQASEIECRLRSKTVLGKGDPSFCLTAHAWAVRGRVQPSS